MIETTEYEYDFKGRVTKRTITRVDEPRPLPNPYPGIRPNYLPPRWNEVTG